MVDYREVLEKLGGELAPGDTHGPSSLITEQSKEVMENFYKNQQVGAYWNNLICSVAIFQNTLSNFPQEALW